jgi:hypothetical protein
MTDSLGVHDIATRSAGERASARTATLSTVTSMVAGPSAR